jgi:hypothetical protein
VSASARVVELHGVADLQALHELPALAGHERMGDGWPEGSANTTMSWGTSIEMIFGGS